MAGGQLLPQPPRQTHTKHGLELEPRFLGLASLGVPSSIFELGISLLLLEIKKILFKVSMTPGNVSERGSDCVNPKRIRMERATSDIVRRVTPPSHDEGEGRSRLSFQLSSHFMG